jgi:hypothetical protein
MNGYMGDNGTNFALKRDSGSAVWNKEGAMVGVVWGSARERHASYLIPIREVLDAVFECTGKQCEVILAIVPEEEIPLEGTE